MILLNFPVPICLKTVHSVLPGIEKRHNKNHRSIHFLFLASKNGPYFRRKRAKLYKKSPVVVEIKI